MSFQADAFQNDAFQVGTPVAVVTGGGKRRRLPTTFAPMPRRGVLPGAYLPRPPTPLVPEPPQSLGRLKIREQPDRISAKAEITNWHPPFPPAELVQPRAPSRPLPVEIARLAKTKAEIAEATEAQEIVDVLLSLIAAGEF